ncbi:hypothetical protein [Ferruginibacter sp.]
MKAVIKAFKILMLFSLFFFSCNRNENRKIEEAAKRLNEFCNVRETKLEVSPKDIFTGFDTLKGIAKQINLCSLDKPGDSIIIRVWFDTGGLQIKQFVLEIGYQNQSYFGAFYEFKTYYPDSSRKKMAKVLSKRDIGTQSQLSQIFNNLIMMDILTLPTMEDLGPGFGGGDGNNYCVEVFSKKHYRYYVYWCPNEFKGRNKFIDQIIMILNYLRKEIKIQDEAC